jgi:hypothetical protein
MHFGENARMNFDPGVAIAFSAIVISFGTLVLGWVAFRDKNRIRAEVVDLRGLVADLRTTVTGLEGKLLECEKRNASLLTENIELMRKLVKTV